MDTDDKKFPIKDYKRGQRIFSQGDDGDRVFLVKSGAVCIFRMVDEEKVILAHLNAGQILGETAIITGEPRSASAEAATACQLVAMTSQQIQDALESSLPFIRALLDQILFRYRDMEKKHLARTQNLAVSLREIQSLTQGRKASNQGVPSELQGVLENIDVIIQAALKKERYVALVPRGYMQF